MPATRSESRLPRSKSSASLRPGSGQALATRIQRKPTPNVAQATAQIQAVASGPPTQAIQRQQSQLQLPRSGIPKSAAANTAVNTASTRPLRNAKSLVSLPKLAGEVPLKQSKAGPLEKPLVGAKRVASATRDTLRRRDGPSPVLPSSLRPCSPSKAETRALQSETKMVRPKASSTFKKVDTAKSMQKGSSIIQTAPTTVAADVCKAQPAPTPLVNKPTDLRIPQSRMRTLDTSTALPSPSPRPGSVATLKRPIPSPATIQQHTTRLALREPSTVSKTTTPARQRRSAAAAPETPAISTLLARDTLLNDSILSLVEEGNVSLASSTSFSQLTPPKPLFDRTRISPQHSPASASFSSPLSASSSHPRVRSTKSLQTSTSRRPTSSPRRDTSSQPRRSTTNDLKTELTRLQAERTQLASRVSTLVDEESRLHALVSTTARDRDLAAVEATEFKVAHEEALWAGVIRAVDEAVEEEMAFRATIGSLRQMILAL